ncbi:MAG: metal-sulfur cluster assembly factor [Candidatus Aenigmarchaeota archaeon]|nr:metal-sulfur cluster assembly factor [Candidatus Aenigmarchaeota archaeon]
MVTETQVRKALENVYDPELRLDIQTLGLIYGVKVKGEEVHIRMTFTTPACPYGPQLVEDVKGAVLTLKGVGSCEVQIVFNPPWKPSEDIKAALGIPY